MVTPCSSIAGSSRYQSGAASQTSTPVAAMQALCAPNCMAPRRSERRLKPARIAGATRLRAGPAADSIPRISVGSVAA
jgi:hypothetical protein